MLKSTSTDRESWPQRSDARLNRILLLSQDAIDKRRKQNCEKYPQSSGQLRSGEDKVDVVIPRLAVDEVRLEPAFPF
jgi:hypothetical protein